MEFDNRMENKMNTIRLQQSVNDQRRRNLVTKKIFENSLTAF